MSERTSIFGWKNVFHNYGWRGILLDSKLPVTISIFLNLTMFFTGADVYTQLKFLLSIGISVVPSMVALILTAYTIVLTFIIGGKFDKIKKTEKGKKLIEDLNSSFAACLLVSTISIITIIIVSSIANMDVAIENPNRINYSIFFLICYLLLYSITILTGIVIDIYNSGQTSLLDEDDNNTNSKN